ncbi:citrate lyase [Secundilactobacillus paracollinoides]|uniref:sugar-binding transcriptional regulator n=1 Tax=Secundilactobacillus paracollinoides TaxID=240427 RepID=UPI0006D00680|nr:sugar-binding domain-containing protein [Secundilactobacillus paracollinoides]ANZ65344.1 citrate lyase [Secundilactobacillus paracollinoides]KRL75044.1 citrate lyase regulator [Secundilactobacillus paracollinoides DSM 15502 = JCM 11969]
MKDIKQQEQIANIARDYYLSKLTISQISKKYQLSRYLISKYLDDSVSTGLVKITINAPIDRNLEMEAQFKKMFTIQNAFILKDADTTNDDYENIVSFAAEEIQTMIHQSTIVGVAWGGTVATVINHFQPEVNDDVTFTQFAGDNLKYNSAFGSTPLVQKAAAKFDARYLTLPGPLYILNDDIRTTFQQEPAMIPTFSAMSRMDMLFSGLGTMASVDSIPQWRNHRDEILGNADDSDVVGFLYGRPYDINGLILNAQRDKFFGASLDSIMAVTHRVGIVKSKFKGRTLLGALRGGLLTDIVTNESVANRVLLEDHHN